MAMQIVFIAPGSGPLVLGGEKNKPVGGAEVQMYLIASELAKSGTHEVRLVVTGKENDFSKGKLRIVVIDRWSIFSRSMSKLWFARPEIVIQRAAGILTFWSWLWSRWKKAKFVYMVAHDMDVAPSGNNFLASNWWWRYFRFAMIRADLVVVQNKFQAEHVSQICRGKILEMENGVPVGTDRRLETERSGVVAMTRLVGFKRPDLYLKLAREIAPVKVTVVAYEDGDEWIRNEYVKAAKEIKNLEWIRGVDWLDTWELINKSKIMVNTSSREGFPNVFLQASALGLPVISLSVDPNGYLEKSNGGIACDDDWKKFVTIVKQTYIDRRKINKWGSNAKQYVLKHNSTERLVREKLLPALNSL